MKQIKKGCWGLEGERRGKGKRERGEGLPRPCGVCVLVLTLL